MQIYLHDLGIENSLTKTGNETLRPKVQSFYGEGNYVIVLSNRKKVGGEQVDFVIMDNHS